ncbi:NADPH-dependent FMN reductase [Synechococcales cyanobacterium C]|uniref:NADPH-dependent FMN reductase n=1 Tax=Petrachloros mirabilis ULC683 TaxID=2781853 RepID=A0A8K2A8S0_9CYAN|nr:NAD(P)H-dependent oxidoreductase [Petrachloros mirabilis]NCJ07220.1 NADPH-dependent FMN reductase [Petrachloros mirabilis ULC683]
MSSSVQILAFAGSAREGSFNKQLVNIAAKGAESVGVPVTVIDLRDYSMPLFDQDLEARSGLPAVVLRFKALMKSHQGLLLACPEYNSSMTPLLKNTIDWASRPEPDEAPLTCFKSKVSVLMSASPGGLGGMRGLVHVRSMLSNLGVLVLPEQKSISAASNAFDAQGNLKDATQQSAITHLGERLATVISKLAELPADGV